MNEPDIVQRLRKNRSCSYNQLFDLCNDAANEIERLRGLVPAGAHTYIKCKDCEEGVRPTYTVAGLCTACARKEIERLRAEVQRTREQRRS